MAVPKDIRPAFDIEQFNELLTTEEKIFVLKNFTEFPTTIKAAINLSPEVCLRSLYNGPVNVTSNCPIRTIFHEWATRIVGDPEAVDICKSEAWMESLFKSQHPEHLSPSHNRSFHFLSNEDCYNHSSYMILEKNMDEYLDRCLSNEVYSDEEKKAMVVYTVRFMNLKVYYLTKVNWIWLKLKPSMRLSKYIDFGKDIEVLGEQELCRSIESINQVFNVHMNRCMLLDANPGTMECRDYGIILRMVDTKQLSNRRFREAIRRVHGTGVYEEAMDWYDKTKQRDVLEEFNVMAEKVQVKKVV